MVTNEQILEALRLVIDPELGLNVVDLGLIYDVQIGEKDIDIMMTLTTRNCPLHESLVEAVRHVAQMSALTKKVNVRLVWDPPWTPERMSENARQHLR